MTRILPFLIALALPAFGGCATSELASQCDGLTDSDEQVACLDAAFQSLRLDQAECLGDDEGDRVQQCFEGCTDSGNDELECRDVCGEGERVGDTARPDDNAGSDDAGSDDATQTRTRERARERERLDGLHLETRDDVEHDERVRERARLIRDGLTEGEELVDCEPDADLRP